LVGIRAYVESPVESYRHVSRFLHQDRHLFHIQSSVRLQDTDHNSLRSKIAELFDSFPDQNEFLICITEISEPRSYQRMDPDIRMSADFFKKPWIGSCSADHKASAKFQPGGSASGSRQRGLH